MKPTEIFELIKNNLSEFETVIKETFEFHYFELTENLLSFNKSDEHLEDNYIDINLNVVYCSWLHHITINFVEPDRELFNDDSKEINFMGVTLYVSYFNELLEFAEKIRNR